MLLLEEKNHKNKQNYEYSTQPNYKNDTPTMMIIPANIMKTLLFHPSTSKVLFILCVFIGSSSIIHTHIWTISHQNSPTESSSSQEPDGRYLRSSQQKQQQHGLSQIVEQQQQHLSKVKIDNRKRAIFYNIFVPDGENRTKAIDIVREQLTMKDELSSVLSSSNNVPIYYTLIGNNPNGQETTQEIQQICGPTCNQIQYISNGNEGITLQSLWEYCTDHPDVQVTYIHNKGSYHPSERNENFRNMLTKGVFSDDCQIGMNNNPINYNIVDDDDADTDSQTQTQSSQSSQTECNICGSRFSTFPHYHMAGNMWTSQCSYIRQLIQPNRFILKMDEMFDYVMLNPDRKIPRPTFQQYTQEYSLGRQRYAYEHWVTSHPYIKPCDVYPGRYTHGYRDLPNRKTTHWNPKLSKGPRWSMEMFLKISMIRGEWFCGQARLYEFKYLYDGLMPKNDSFIWDYYTKRYKGCEMPLNRTLHYLGGGNDNDDGTSLTAKNKSTTISSNTNKQKTAGGGGGEKLKYTTNVPIQLRILKDEGEY